LEVPDSGISPALQVSKNIERNFEHLLARTSLFNFEVIGIVQVMVDGCGELMDPYQKYSFWQGST
jgi:hypothetical protein